MLKRSAKLDARAWVIGFGGLWLLVAVAKRDYFAGVAAVGVIIAGFANYVEGTGHPMDGYLPTLVTILECPGIAIALAIGAMFSGVKAHAEESSGAPAEQEHGVYAGWSQYRSCSARCSPPAHGPR